MGLKFSFNFFFEKRKLHVSNFFLSKGERAAYVNTTTNNIIHV